MALPITPQSVVVLGVFLLVAFWFLRANDWM